MVEIHRVQPRARSVLAHSKGVMRLSEIVEVQPAGEAAVREQLEDLEEEGEVKLFQVGEHTMVKATGDLKQETRDRDGPRSDQLSEDSTPVPVWKH